MRLIAVFIFLCVSPVLAQDIVVTYTITGTEADAVRAKAQENIDAVTAANVGIQGTRDAVTASNAENSATNSVNTATNTANQATNDANPEDPPLPVDLPTDLVTDASLPPLLTVPTVRSYVADEAPSWATDLAASRVVVLAAAVEAAYVADPTSRDAIDTAASTNGR